MPKIKRAVVFQHALAFFYPLAAPFDMVWNLVPDNNARRKDTKRRSPDRYIRIVLELTKSTDADLIEAIDNMIDERGGKMYRQTAVKKLLRKALYGEPEDWIR